MNWEILSKALNVDLETIAKIVLEPLDKLVKYGLDNWKEKDEADLKAHLITLYVYFDVFFQDMALETETGIDDKIVSEIMQGIEAKAKELKLELPNLDQD